MPKICRDKSNLIVVQDKITNSILTDVVIFEPMVNRIDYVFLCTHPELGSFMEDCKRHWADIEDGTPRGEE